MENFSCVPYRKKKSCHGCVARDRLCCSTRVFGRARFTSWRTLGVIFRNPSLYLTERQTKTCTACCSCDRLCCSTVLQHIHSLRLCCSTFTPWDCVAAHSLLVGLIVQYTGFFVIFGNPCVCSARKQKKGCIACRSRNRLCCSTTTQYRARYAIQGGEDS